MKEFNNWFKDRVTSNVSTDEIKKLSSGPIFTMTIYQAYDINGYIFYTVQQDKKSIYQNSGSTLMLMITTSKRPNTMVK